MYIRDKKCGGPNLEENEKYRVYFHTRFKKRVEEKLTYDCV